MDDFFALADDEQRGYFAQAANQLGLSAASVEKDFWVCWVLRELFALPDHGRHLTFKGGTSLSKGWQLIKRFSEDIDVVIDRTSLDIDPPDEPDITGGERDRRLERLKIACRTHIEGKLTPALKRRLHERLPKDIAWTLSPDPQVPDGQTLLFAYPAVTTPNAYLPPLVKIELGARSDTDPSQTPPIQSYLAEAFPGKMRSPSFQIRTLAPERTFWEKAMLLHEEAYRRESRGPKARMARHYYDLWCLINAGVPEKAVSSPGLFDRVVAHRSVFFRKSKEAQETMRRGSIVLLPTASQRQAWEEDYNAMRETHFFEEPPLFADILNVVGGFADTFNSGVGP